MSKLLLKHALFIPDMLRAMAGGKTVGENYAFAGMHHIFDDLVGHAGKLEKLRICCRLHKQCAIFIKIFHTA